MFARQALPPFNAKQAGMLGTLDRHRLQALKRIHLDGLPVMRGKQGSHWLCCDCHTQAVFSSTSAALYIMRLALCSSTVT